MKTWLALTATVTLCACEAADDPHADDTDPPVPFERFPAADVPPDVRTDRLCAEAADPHGADDTVFIDCRLEGGSFAPASAAPNGPLTVVVWNLERGLGLDGQLAAWATGDVPLPDVLIASELDRGCSRTDHRDVPRDIAEALELDYVFGVEFLELPRASGPGGSIEATCEHGNAIFSRFPLGNARAVRHAAHQDWYTPPDELDGNDEPRLGGRVAVVADTLVGDQLLRVVSVHFESRLDALHVQNAQGEETAALAEASPVPVLVGGDTNSFGYTFDLAAGRTTADEVEDGTIGPLLRAGLVDAHADLPAEDRPTRSVVVIDLLLGRDVRFTDPWICPEATCGPLSDHRAIAADVTLTP